MDEVMETSESGVLFSFSKTWKSSPRSKASLRVGPHADLEEAETVFAKALAEMGYTRPRWWEYWRWGEYRLSDHVQSKIDTALKEQVDE